MRVGNRILLIEDDAPLRRSLEKFLERAGYTFDSCATARDALALAEKHRHVIVLVEYHLPDSNGTSLLEKLKRIVPHVAAVMISEYDFQSVANDIGNRADVLFFLKKPFDVADLESALSSACSGICPSRSVGERKQEMFFEGIPAFTLR
ncbi:MAG: response regulator [Acidobacteriota bacterium]